jgi:DNA-binding response OmpR family regulator
MTARVLLLERDDQLRSDYRSALEAEGYEVKSVTEADDALAAVRQGWPDVAVLNLSMPGIDGTDLLLEMAKLDQPVPFVISALPAAETDDLATWATEGFVSEEPDFPGVKQRVSEDLARESQSGAPSVA